MEALLRIELQTAKLRVALLEDVLLEDALKKTAPETTTPSGEDSPPAKKATAKKKASSKSKKGVSVDELNAVIIKTVKAGMPHATVKAGIRKIVPDVVEGGGLTQFSASQRTELKKHFDAELARLLAAAEEEENGGDTEEEEEGFGDFGEEDDGL